jgi:phage tail sheath protein FI
MPELLSPGVFIEETASTTNIIASASTSNLGLLGWTPQGPTNVATYVSSYPQFAQTFGSFDTRSLLAYSLAAFFSNGGKQAYITRVAPSDAVAAQLFVEDTTTDQEIALGDGTTTAFSATATASVLKDNSGASPIIGGQVVVRWRGLGTLVSTENLVQADGATPLVGVTSQSNYTGRIIASSLPAFDYAFYSVAPVPTVTLTWTSGSSPYTQVLTAPTAGNFTTTTIGPHATVAFDWKTGVISMKFASLPPDNATNLQLTYTPTGATQTQTLVPGSGNPPTAGHYVPATGAYAFTAGVAPHNHCPVFATYTIAAWTVNPISVGAWANNYSVTFTGSQDSFTASTNSFSKFTVQVLYTDPSTGAVSVKENYEDLVFSDPTSTSFGPDVINEFSSYVRFVEPGADEAPQQLQGIQRVHVIGGGDELSATSDLTFTTTLGYLPIQPRTIIIAYTDTSGTARKVTDDGNGNLVGDVDLSYSGGNTVSYSLGTLTFRASVAIKGGTLVTVTYYSKAAAAVVSEKFGDTSKAYTVGTDGTFDSTHFGRGQFTSPSLLPAQQGLYAFDLVDDILQIAVPDFSGDTTVSGDLLTYAATRASSPAGGDRFVILSTPVGLSAQGAVNWFRYTFGQYSDYAALYWPWIKITDPITNRSKTVPSQGHVAGIYARTDNTRNVGKAPGGTIDGQLSFLTGLERTTTQGDRDLVYPNKINPLISSPNTGNAVWGVRTISLDSQWRYINARRLFMFVEKSVYNATFWVVFENNGAGLWAKIKAQLDGFLGNLFNQGYFAGTSPSQGYFVVCDETNNPPSSVSQGIVYTDVGIAPNTPAEFVVFRFAQMTSSS